MKGPKRPLDFQNISFFKEMIQSYNKDHHTITTKRPTPLHILEIKYMLIKLKNRTKVQNTKTKHKRKIHLTL